MHPSTVVSLLSGVAASGGLAFGVLLLVGLTGAFDPADIEFVSVGLILVAAAAAGAQRRIEPTAFRAGAGAALAVVVIWELLSGNPGFGPVQSAGAGAALAMGVVGPRILAPLTKPVSRGAIALGSALLTGILIMIVIGSGQLGHDESAYALQARSWLYGTPDSGWDLHRGIGQSVIASVVLPLTQSPLGLRAVAVVLALGSVVALWALGREMRSSRVGLLAAAVFAVAPTFLRRGTEFLTDLPAAGLLFVVTLLVWRWLVRPQASARVLYAAAGVAALAYYIRYQSILSLGLLIIAAAVSSWPRVRAGASDLGKTALLGLGLLVPHFVHSTITTGTPWGILLETAGAGGRQYLGEGIVDYAQDFPDLLAGQLGAVAIAVALGWGLSRLASRDGRRPALFLLVPALGQFLLLGLVSHGEPRLVFFPVGLLLVAAGLGLDDLRRRIPSPLYRTGTWVVVAALLTSLVVHGQRFDAYAEARADNFSVLVQAADIVISESGERCGIITGLQPQMTWLSGCETSGFPRQPQVPFPDEIDTYLLFTEAGPRQPTGGRLAEFLDLTEGEPIEIPGEGSLGSAELWRVK